MQKDNQESTKALLFTFTVIIFLLFILPTLITMLIGNFSFEENKKELYLTENTKVDENKKRRNDKNQEVIINIKNDGGTKEKLSILIEAYKKSNELFTSKNITVNKIDEGTIYETHINIDIGDNSPNEIYYKITLFYNEKEIDVKIIS